MRTGAGAEAHLPCPALLSGANVGSPPLLWASAPRQEDAEGLGTGKPTGAQEAIIVVILRGTRRGLDSAIPAFPSHHLHVGLPRSPGTSLFCLPQPPLELHAAPGGSQGPQLPQGECQSPKPPLSRSSGQVAGGASSSSQPRLPTIMQTEPRDQAGLFVGPCRLDRTACVPGFGAGP